jgi:hypothetical protein
MVGNPDHTRTYLTTYLYKLASLCGDAKTSFSMLVQSTNQLRPPRRPQGPMSPYTRAQFFSEMAKWGSMRKTNASLNRIALDSFIITSANISKLVWPPVADNVKDEEKKKKMDRRRRRKEHLDKFFPSETYQNLKNKGFRNFLEHFDDELDKLGESGNGNSNIAMDTMGFSRGISTGTITGNITVLNDFDYNTFTITYYDEKKGSETANLNDMYQEIMKLQDQIPKALVEINDAPPNHYDFIIDE